MAEATTEVPQQGLPQLNVIADGSYTNQVAWLALTFIFLFIVVARAILPRVTKVMEEREERIAGDLDTAERFKRDAEDVKTAYEDAVAAARKNAQETILSAREEIQADIAKAQADLDATLAAKTAEAEAHIAKVREDALAGVDDIAADVAGELVAKIGGVASDDPAVAAAVKAALTSVKGA